MIDMKLFDMTSNEVFKAIREGKMAQEDFVAWLEWIEEESRAEGYNSGRYIGYDVGYINGKYGYDA